MQSIESNLDELERLRTEVDKLTTSIRSYEARETENEQAKENEDLALTKVEILTMKLQARDAELARSKKAFDAEIEVLKTRLDKSTQEFHSRQPKGVQSILDSALATSRSRLVEIQKAHNHLLKRYTALQSAYLELKDERDSNEPLLSGGDPRPLLDSEPSYRPGSPTPDYRRNRPHAVSDLDSFDGVAYNVTPPVAASGSNFPVRPVRLDTTHHAITPTGSNAQSPSSQHSTQFQTSQPFSPHSKGSVEGNSHGGHSETDQPGKPKINPQSDVRIYGRGGVQNIGKKEKEKKDKKKDEQDKKDKKTMGIRGIRGFV